MIKDCLKPITREKKTRGKRDPNVMKKALIIGINYRGTKSQLSGCINDANKMKAYLLSQCGFKESELKDREYRYIIHNVSGTIISEDLLEDNVIITSCLSSGQYFLTLVNRRDQILLRKSFIKL